MNYFFEFSLCYYFFEAKFAKNVLSLNNLRNYIEILRRGWGWAYRWQMAKGPKRVIGKNQGHNNNNGVWGFMDLCCCHFDYYWGADELLLSCPIFLCLFLSPISILLTHSPFRPAPLFCLFLSISQYRRLRFDCIPLSTFFSLFLFPFWYLDLSGSPLSTFFSLFLFRRIW